MLDLELVRNHPEIIKEAARVKGIPVDVDAFLGLDEERRKLIQEVEKLRQERNDLSQAIPRLDPSQRPQALQRAAAIKKELEEKEPRLRDVEEAWRDLLLRLPNPPAPGTPVGESADDNVEIRRVGEIPSFAFPPRDHMELLELHDAVEIERAVKFAGSRSYILKNMAVFLEMALMQMALDLLRERGYTPMSVPVMVREEAMVGTGYFPLGREEVYHLQRDDLFLIGTSEVSLVASRQQEIIPKEELPLRLAGISPCFRREVGSAGKDVRGLYRVHQFMKVEQVIIAPADPELSHQLHMELLQNAEDLLQKLELPYRVVHVCTGDMGQGQVEKHDIETWMPSRGSYGETHSCSSFYDFQARRSGIRYLEGGKPRYAYTLNNTLAASPRLLIALLENHQREDGSIYIPPALRPYMGGLEVIQPRGPRATQKRS
ncbi:MAG: serine--tRNA ligase [Clostridiales bacterium]|nr:serine--tRNA ligase [Clostridiales bacterium]